MKESTDNSALFDLEALEEAYKALPEESVDQIKKLAVDVIFNNQSIKNSMNLKDEHIEAMYAIGYSRFRLHKFEEAKCFFQLLSILDHNNPKYLLAIAACYRMSGDFDKAILMYHILIKQHPTYIDAYINLGECFFKTENWDDLIEMINLIEAYTKIKPLSRYNSKRYNTLHAKYLIRRDVDKASEAS